MDQEGGCDEMTDKSPPPANASTSTDGANAPSAASSAGPSSAGPATTGEAEGGGGATSPRKSKKKTRLMWDEENLQLNALEMERHPKMKIDEPKTPFERGPGSEAGSSTSGSAPGSPAPYFIPKERLRGFEALEASRSASSADVGNSLRRSVQIVDERDPAADGSPSGSNDEFIAKRRKHYANEARLMRAECEEDRSRDEASEAEPLGASAYNPPSSAVNSDISTAPIAGNGIINMDAQVDDDAIPNGHGHGNSNTTVPNGTS